MTSGYCHRLLKVTEGLAEKLGYKSSSSPLKPYDERMFKAIITINQIKIPRKDYFFDDLYAIIFDIATSRRLDDIIGSPNLRLVTGQDHQNLLNSSEL